MTIFFGRSLEPAGSSRKIITGIPWTEIDFPEDVAYANNIILTALQDRAARL